MPPEKQKKNGKSSTQTRRLGSGIWICDDLPWRVSFTSPKDVGRTRLVLSDHQEVLRSSAPEELRQHVPTGRKKHIFLAELFSVDVPISESHVQI